MSKRIRKSAPKGSIAADKAVSISPYTKPMPSFDLCDRSVHVEPGEADWADLNLAGLDVIARASTSRRKVKVWQDADGRWWRTAGVIFVRPSKDGTFRFCIVTRRGANERDADYFESIVERATQGEFLRHGWRPYSNGDGRDGWIYSYSRPYKNPFVHSDHSGLVTPCTDNRCLERWHAPDGDDHAVDYIDKDGYNITVQRYESPEEPDGEYQVHVNADADLAPEQVASFVSDLHWAAEAARHANATPIDTVVKGMRNPRAYWENRRALEQTEQGIAA